MEIKIFRPGFTEAEFNEFGREHIISKYQMFNDGTVYVMYKPKTQIGVVPMDLIERIDNTVKQAALEIFDCEIGLAEENQTLADTKEALSKLKPNQKGWDKLEETRKQCEVQIKMHKETIATRKKQIALFLDKHKTLV